ncbi:MAG TPA: hypothetical protein VFT20_01700 [Candidatus Limnocylindrales bacterium]|nr:hypothetical protein [Candidatus Limnocylindrales bacterium]
MRRSIATRRLVALATMSALLTGLVGVSSPTAAREPGSGGFGGRDLRMADPGSGRVSGSGTRGIVDPARLPDRRSDGLQRPLKPDLARGTSDPTGVAAPDPAGVALPPDPVEVSTTANPPAGRPGTEGFYFGSSAATAFQPADPWVAVGPDHVIQVVNTAMQILDRSGNVVQTAALSDFFLLPPGYGNADPRVVYDALHQRWVMTELSWTCFEEGGGVGYIDYLVSTTADPTDPWTLNYFEYEGYLPDYPAIGTSTVNVAFAANVFQMSTGAGNCLGPGVAYAGTELLFVDWPHILTPPSSGIVFDYFPLGPDFFTLRAAVQTPATSPTIHSVVQWDDPDDGIGTGPVIPGYFAFTGSSIAGTLDVSGVSHLTEDGVVAPFVEPPDPLQPGSTPIVTNRIDSRPTDAIWQANRLSWVSTGGCIPSGDDGLQACVRVTQVSTSGAVPAPRQDFLVAEADHDAYFGGIGEARDGTLHVVWTSSSSDGEYPSSYTGYQLAGDADDTLSSPELLKAGVGPSFTGSRWGDYSGVAQDPQVPNAVWQGNTYSGGGPLWRTWVSQLQTSGSSYVPVAPVRVLDSRPGFGIGLTGVFAANTPRTFGVAGLFGIPAAAVAVTGNVTIVNQTAAGYLSVTPTPVANPLSSTINFPLGDTRANNLTIPVGPNGTLSAVYKASGGRSTHVIVDITGYFLPGDEDATYATITPVRVLDSRFNTGLPGTFKPNVPRTLSIAGANGIPADAVAITGNLTVVGQTRAGYLSVTREPTATPTTSTLNFPVGDTRANGVSVPLNGQGDLSIVYKSSGGTTHVILDVTGYYRNVPSGLLFHPLTPGRILETRPGFVLSGLTGPFSANTPRRLDVAGHWGAPAGADAITGNLTVVGQTAGGYVSATLVSNVNPTTSVLNFPLGDVRANGVTLPLDDPGREWFVYKAPGGRQTHLILDLSGYFD